MRHRNGTGCSRLIRTRPKSVSPPRPPAGSPIGQCVPMSYIGRTYIGAAVTRSGTRTNPTGTPEMTDTTSIKHPTPLTSGDFTAAEDPFALFGEWFAEAVKAEPNDPNAMSLATVDADGLPDRSEERRVGKEVRDRRLSDKHKRQIENNM